mmetsp:Transcript_8774/g.33112  ORF Transcript_8774/g.33112 Transcript_8774/m.33112 type:complete len:487 (-) Transcript_8774:618-2078(-)
MAGLVIRDHFLLVLVQETMALQPADDAVDRPLEVRKLYFILVKPRSLNRRLVADVRNVGADEAWRQGREPAGELVGVRVGAEAQLAHVDEEDLLAPRDVRPVDHDLPVEATGAGERVVKDVHTVRSREHHDVRGAGEAVHFYEEGVQRVLALVVPAHDAASTLTAHGIDLVDEDDARRVLARLLEEVAHATGTHADEKLYKVGARHGEEGHVRFASRRLRQEGLSRSGGTAEDRSLRNLGAEVLKLLRVLQELHELHDLLLRLLTARDVLERDIHIFLGDLLRPAASDVEDGSAAPRVAHEVEDRAEDEQGRKELEHLRAPAGLLHVLHGDELPRAHPHLPLRCVELLLEAFHRADGEVVPRDGSTAQPVCLRDRVAEGIRAVLSLRAVWILHAPVSSIRMIHVRFVALPAAAAAAAARSRAGKGRAGRVLAHGSKARRSSRRGPSRHVHFSLEEDTCRRLVHHDDASDLTSGQQVVLELLPRDLP